MTRDTILTLYLCFWLAIAGAAFGSFLDCAVWRWVHGEPIGKGRSRCGSCGHTLAAWDLVPVFSYLFMRGRCRYCNEKIPAECFWAEIAGAAGFVCMGLRFGISAALGQWLVFAVLLLAVSLTDAEARLIPDPLVLTIAVNRVVWALLLQEALWDSVKAAIISWGVGPFALLVLTLLMERMLGKEVMGGGDIKLLMAFALYLKWPQMILTLFLGCLCGILGAAAAKKRGAFAFGPYLAAACVITVCFGDPLIQWYIKFF